MRVTSQDLSNIEELVDFRRYVSLGFKQITEAINGKLSIADNLQASLVSVTFSGANTTVQVSHGLDKIPTGYIVTKRSANLTVFDGSGSNTDKVIYLQASSAGTASVLIF